MAAIKFNPWALVKFNETSDEVADRFLKDNQEMMAKERSSNSQNSRIVINNPVELSDQ